MSNPFQNSETKKNLMRAFAGESQARNRYDFAAGLCQKQGLAVVEAVFRFTAQQEREHAEIFYQHLQELSGENIAFDAAYPVDLSSDVAQLLRMAEHNEYEERDSVYQSFEETARQEGFPAVASSFRQIARIEGLHGQRFGKLAELLEEGKLFVSDVSCGWMCLNCGHVFQGKQAPKACPVCGHDQGFFLRLEMAPFAGGLFQED